MICTLPACIIWLSGFKWHNKTLERMALFNNLVYVHTTPHPVLNFLGNYMHQSCAMISYLFSTVESIVVSLLKFVSFNSCPTGCIAATKLIWTVVILNGSKTSGPLTSGKALKMYSWEVYKMFWGQKGGLSKPLDPPAFRHFSFGWKRGYMYFWPMTLEDWHTCRLWNTLPV